MIKPIIISFELITSNQNNQNNNSNWNKILKDLKLQLPLRNLHWKSSTRTIRTLQSLNNLNFKPLFELNNNYNNNNSLLDRPYLHLLFVICDVS